MASDSDKRKLTDLRVVDLRAELEKRGLDKIGVKATLIERLQKILREEGHDPDEYLFESEKKTPKRNAKRGEQDTESETQSNADENHDASMEVDEDKEKDDDDDDDEKLENGKDTTETVPDVKQNPQIKEEMDVDDSKIACAGPDSISSAVKLEFKSEVKSEMKTEESSEANAMESSGHRCGEVDKNVPEANGVDNEDSINLTIGEDEEKLLADEEDSSSQEKEAKDEGESAGVSREESTAGGDGKKEAGGQEEGKEASGEDKEDKVQEEHKDDKGDKGKSAQSPATEQKQSKDDKDKKIKQAVATGSSRNLWVSGLSSSTRATDLKQVFSKYGKVIGAKVVTNARTPGARCYGYVTMATSEDASKCIQHLHRTELHGRMISVERAKGDATGPPRKSADGRAVSSSKKIDEKKKHERKLSTGSKVEDKKGDKEEKKEGDKEEIETKKEGEDEGKAADEAKEKSPEGDDSEKGKEDSESKKDGEKNKPPEKHRSREVSRDRRDRERHRSAGSSRYSRPHSRSPHRRPPYKHLSPSRKPGVLTFTQIREERERQRLRDRERELREEERRRREEMARQREIERRQREEAIRLEREKERLRIERERIECERAELMRLERERQRMEREKLEREREELKRQQLRFEEARRSAKRSSDDRRDSYGEDRKRVATERRFDNSQSRFEEGSRSNDYQAKKDLKHSRDYNRRSGSGYDQEARASRGEGIVMRREASHELPRREHAVPDVGRGKDGRFERGLSFRVRDERRPESDHRPKVDVRHSTRDRYPETTKGESRYSDRSGDTWHAGGGPTPVKPFSSMSTSGVPTRDSWGTSGDRKSDGGQNWGRPLDSGTTDRWVTGGSGPMGVVGRSGPSMGGPGSMYTSQQNVSPNPPGMNMSMSGGGPYGGDRFDAYKPSMGPIRKY